MQTTSQKLTLDTHKKRERNPSITLKNSTKPQRKKQANKQKTKRITKKRKPINKMGIMMITYLLIVTLNVNGLNAPIKKTQGH